MPELEPTATIGTASTEGVQRLVQPLRVLLLGSSAWRPALQRPTDMMMATIQGTAPRYTVARTGMLQVAMVMRRMVAMHLTRVTIPSEP